jgi:carbamoyl-phosphate synthase large subunit
MIGDSDVIKTCRDKHRFARAVEAAGLPIGRSVDLETFRRDPFYPCFAKPLDGSGSIGAGVIVDERSLVRHVGQFGEQLVIQDVLDGGEYTIDVYRTRSGAFKAIVPRQRLVVRGGEVEQGRTVNDPALIEATRQLVSHFDGLWGAMCCQCRRRPDGPTYFFELNPRFGGGVPLSIRAGADLPMYLLQEVLGREVDGAVGQFTDHLLMMRYPAGTIFHVENPSQLRGFEGPIFR